MSDDGLRLQRPEPPAPRRRRWAAPLLIGVAVALVLGLAVGFWAKPNLDGNKTPAGASTAAANTQAPLAIEVAPGANSVASASGSKPGGKLEVLPPDMAAAANARAQAASQPPPAAPFAEGSGAPAATLAPAPAQSPPQVFPPPAPQSQSAPPPPPQAYAAAYPPRPGPSDRCAVSASLADQMVCHEPRLAAAERELARAYRRALASGVPPGELRAEQRDFAFIRDDAARRSPRALASAYAQRIDELNAMADDARADEGPGL